MSTFKIGKHEIGTGAPCFIIAEAGVNHNGRIDLAEQLIDTAAAAGADAVKFQTYKTSELILPHIDKAPYQRRTTDSNEEQEQMLKDLEIDEIFHQKVIDRCRRKDILFLSTPYDRESLDLLLKLGVEAIKIASTDTTNLLFLEAVAQAGKPVILSTGMSTPEEIEQAVTCLKENGCVNLALLKCTSYYPTKPDEVNLAGMSRLSELFDSVIGFSDHTEGIGASPYAVARGAKIVEKHFTIDKNLPGPDHQASLSVEELNNWVKAVRDVEVLLGKSDLQPTESEKINRKSLQKNFVAGVEILRNTKLDRSHLKAKRTGGAGIPANELYAVLGKRVKETVLINTPIYRQNLE